MRRDVFLSVSAPLGEQFLSPPLPEHALDGTHPAFISSHVVANSEGMAVVTLWRSTVELPDGAGETGHALWVNATQCLADPLPAETKPVA